ncbi:O-antigen ligase [Pseudomonas benzenivorans]|nr:O-antigen ligase family protein [Pseudomonas benzenivorans]SDG58561.1 O-antigen ligase [Pseudomonas benzenivorans]
MISNLSTPATGSLSSRCARLSDWMIRYLLPIGWLVLLTGLFWSWDRTLYHKLYYALIAAPTMLILVLQPGLLKKLLRNPLILAFIAFGCYTVLSLLWSDTDNKLSSLAKRPLYVLMLFLGVGLLALKSPQRLGKLLLLAGIVAAGSGALSFAYHLHSTAGARLSGYGALFNPLLTAHVYGFFAAFWLATWFSRVDAHSRAVLPAVLLLVLGVVVLSTGSRTPLLALSITLIWLAATYPGRSSLIAGAYAMAMAAALLLLLPDALLLRGLSYRPEIWLGALQIAVEDLWFGHGFDHTLSIPLQTKSLTFNDPHNIELAVLLSGGLTGLLLWVNLYAIALLFAWRNRHDALVMTASALVVYGLGASLTEGRDFISRPKEHWFLIWIPLSLLAATWFARDLPRPQSS